MSFPTFPGKWDRKSLRNMIMATINAIVFLCLDFLDIVFCIIYRIIDKLKDGKCSECYCYEDVEKRRNRRNDDKESEISETLYMRKNFFRDLGFSLNKIGDSDCGEWIKNSDKKLHVVVKDPSPVSTEDCIGNSNENVIFLHGLFSSSSVWTKTVFPNLSDPIKRNYRLFAVDLLGFGKSPMPENCMYTVRDHMEMIEKSVICPFKLKSFHLVAHSMGGILALALAAKYSKRVKSITLVATPYFPYSGDGTNFAVLNGLAERKLLPLTLFYISVLSWYQHLGRFMFFLSFGKHPKWISEFGSRKRNVQIVESTKHYHHAGWHTMHNVICGGAKLTDEYLQVLINGGVKIRVIHGDQDQVAPLECANNLKMKVEDVDIILNADHTTVVSNRRNEFTQDLEHFWVSSAHILK